MAIGANVEPAGLWLLPRFAPPSQALPAPFWIASVPPDRYSLAFFATPGMCMSMRSAFGVVAFCGVTAIAWHTVHAAPLCTRADVDFYLRKAFTQTQITAICSGAPAEPGQASVVYAPPATATSPASATSPAPQRTPAELQLDSDERFLNNAIDAYDVSLGDGKLYYTRKQCVDYGDQDPGGYRNRACPLVRYAISLKELKIISTRRKFLVYGENKIVVQGQVTREVVGNLDAFDEKSRALIHQVIEQGSRTDIPVRSGVSLDRVSDTLRKLSG